MRQLAGTGFIICVALALCPARADAACVAIGNAYRCGYEYAYPYPYDYYERFRENAFGFFGQPVGYPNPFYPPRHAWYRKRR